ncbi:FkbM family methyltransferase [Brevibacterium luteolum]|uniref:FkbM family methyltransferase n=1 Tax=Brevibacterium luteolum TaxID=199591 RepID=UPI0021AFA541|nr:FkbM family methyltransferase [Brevibacterium luteolum]MCT1828848.1 FkbM family methyltransferase [Brevibacterium luteolum]
MGDYRRTFLGRRQQWFGLKPAAKRALASPLLHPLLRPATRLPGITIGRLPAPAHLTEVTGRVRTLGAPDDAAEFVLLRPDRCEIAKEMYWGAGRRTSAADAFALDLMATRAADAEVFLDIGAYTGIFSLALAAAHADLEIHAFEMVPAVADACQANIERNGFGQQIALHRIGVGDPDVVLSVPCGDGGSALPSFYSVDMEFSSGTEVSCRSLDGFAKQFGPGDRVLLKVDVEGAENTVFGFGQQLLAAHRPEILCEVLPARAQPRELEKLLAPHGYSYYLVGEGVLEHRQRIVPDEDFRDWFFTTATPGELAAAGVPVRD